MGRFRDKLEIMLDSVEPKENLRKWIKGYIPSDESYTRCSIPKKDRIRLAKIGFTEFYLHFGIELYFTQSLIVGAFLSKEYDTGRVIATPRYGKSMIEGGLADYLAVNDYHVSIVADKSSRTAKVMEHARKLLRSSSGFVKRELVEDERKQMSKADRLLKSNETAYSKQRIIFKNGNKIDTKSTGDSYTDSTRGNEAIGDGTHVLIDEMDFISEEALAELGRREFETDSGRKLILFGISNPRFSNHFREAMENENLAKGEFSIWLNVRTAIEEGNVKLSKEEVLNSEFAKTEDSIRINLLCEYDDEKSDFFDEPMIEATRRELNVVNENTIAALGIDSAFSGTDKISVTLALLNTDDEQPIKIIDIANLKPEEWDNKTSTRDIVDSIVGLSKMYPIKAIATDVGQGSHLVVEMAEREELKHIGQYTVNFGSRPTPEKVKAGVDTAVLARNKRAEMYLSLRELMRERKIVYNRDYKRTLLKQMAATRLKEQTGDKMTLIDKDVIKRHIKESPDELDSVVLVVHALELLMLGVESR